MFLRRDAAWNLATVAQLLAVLMTKQPFLSLKRNCHYNNKHFEYSSEKIVNTQKYFSINF